MITIVEPKEHIVKLWGKQKAIENETYRLIKYVLRVDHDGKVLLHNVVTGQLVILDQEEIALLEKLPAIYGPVAEQLVSDHFLVPESYDEHTQVLNLRYIYRKLDDANSSQDILGYTILPTTACNARCYYCFEQGIKQSTMTKETADDLIAFMCDHCGERKLLDLVWFGGEPTIASSRIDQICKGLREKNINFRSKMMTNGYLFDEEMVDRAKNLWNLWGLQICVDGTEETYNRIKAFVGVKDNPYKRIMNNIGMLLENGIAVGLRMNYDIGNHEEFESVVREAYERFGNHKLLSVVAHPVIGEYKYVDGKIYHGDDSWFTQKESEMDAIARKYGYVRREKGLPFLNFSKCSACNEASVTVRPDGGIVRCPQLLDDDELTGTVKDGISNREIVQSWKQANDAEVCWDCELFPNCNRLVRCPDSNYCHRAPIYKERFKNMINELYQAANSQK